MIVAVVLVLVGVVWWNWSQVDSRFLGKWDLYPYGVQMLVPQSNGTAYIIHSGFASEEGTPVSEEFDWGVSGDHLVLGARSKPRADFLRFIEPAYRAVSGKRLYRVQSVWTIASVTSDELRVLQPFGPNLTYRRIHE